MNAQSNHPIRTSTTRTTDPQFLGPEAGQQAGGEKPGVSKLNVNNSGRRFVVEAGYSDPAARHGHERDNLADCEIHATRKATNQRARFFLLRGCWVEVYDGDTKELLAGPFDPDQPAPACIV